ncbi:organic cation/carnitine transporter 7-like [Melia azedarach]|uniref:Organic cation/carnitine transporter 7-like n=1 Tax=Melia azedarach TaxID=155640 RepID=A0ACC1XCM5_MELAZ|nr:organic cation/carnitine transporter 7-like [Melia azedarach]
MQDHSPVYTVDEALDSVGFGKYQVVVLAYAGLGWVAEAMEVMILSFVGPVVKSEWNLSSTDESLITTVVFAGLVVGAYAWGIVSDVHGRRMGFLGEALAVGMCSYPGFWSLFLLQTEECGWLSFQLSGVLDQFLRLYLHGLSCQNWVGGRTTDAHRALEKIAQVNKTSLPHGTLVCEKTTLPIEESTSSERVHLLSAHGGNKTTKPKSGFSLFFMLFSSKLIRTTVLLWLLLFGNSFAYYAVVLLISELSSSESKCGTSMLLIENLQNDNIYIDEFITSLAEIPGLILAAVLVDRVGRKLSITIMFVLSFIFLLPLVTHQSNILATALLFGARMSIMGTFTVSLIYAAEIYPTFIRSTGTGAANAMGRIGGMVCPLIAVAMVASCHQTSAVILLEVVIVISVISVLLIPFETKGKELSDTVNAL